MSNLVGPTCVWVTTQKCFPCRTVTLHYLRVCNPPDAYACSHLCFSALFRVLHFLLRSKFSSWCAEFTLISPFWASFCPATSPNSVIVSNLTFYCRDSTVELNEFLLLFDQIWFTRYKPCSNARPVKKENEDPKRFRETILGSDSDEKPIE